MIRYPKKHIGKCSICGEPCYLDSPYGVCPDCKAKADAKEKRHKPPKYQRNF